MASPPSGCASASWPNNAVREFSTSYPLATAYKTNEDEDEWEYEYSTTETETYYVTMDLSHSGMFDKVRDNFHSGNRGGYKQWFNPVYADPNKNTRLRPTNTTAMVFGDDKDDADDEDLPAEEEDDLEPEPPTDRSGTTLKAETTTTQQPADDDIPIDPALQPQREPTRAPSQNPSRAPSRAPSVAPQSEPATPKKRIRNLGEVQILDFHADNPIISYKGRIFSGSWASNIGTELIFGAHDEIAERGLPHLQALPGGVDLMAASTCRILTTPADLRHKNRFEGHRAKLTLPYANRPRAPDKYRQIRKELLMEIPVHWDKHGRRKPQARFLENLMAIKRQRGEFDVATTMTRDTMHDFVDKEADPEEATAQKKRARDRRRQLRLQAERAAKPKTKRRGGNRWLKKKMVTFEDEHPGLEVQGAGAPFSMLTPKTWDQQRRDSDGGASGE